MVPDRIASLSLVSTAARLMNTVVCIGLSLSLDLLTALSLGKGYLENLRNRINML